MSASNCLQYFIMICKIRFPYRYCLYFSRARKVLENRGITDDERVSYKSLIRVFSLVYGTRCVSH